jgi:hypothetical protein
LANLHHELCIQRFANEWMIFLHLMHMCLNCVLNTQHPYTKFRNFCISHNFHYQIVECKVCDTWIKIFLTIVNIDDLLLGVQLLNNTLFHIFKGDGNENVPPKSNWFSLCINSLLKEAHCSSINNERFITKLAKNIEQFCCTSFIHKDPFE